MHDRDLLYQGSVPYILLVKTLAGQKKYIVCYNGAFVIKNFELYMYVTVSLYKD